MKHILRKSALLGLCGLVAFVMAAFVKAENIPLTIDLDSINDYLQKVRFHTLMLGSGEEVELKLSTDEKKLNIGKGLVVGKASSVSNSSSYVIIGGGENNSINGNASYGGIAGGRDNKVQNESTVIGGGASNSATGKNAVIVGGDSNGAKSLGVVVGGKMNVSDEGGVVLGGSNNTAKKNSLALGQNAQGNDGSFGWNANASANSARIDASAGVLIGTYQKKAGVNVVVDGAVQVKGKPNLGDQATRGEIRGVDGCFYVFDGNVWHFINKGDPSQRCNKNSLAASCDFGSTIVWEGDKVDGYLHSYAPTTGYPSCVKVKLECRHDGFLYTSAGDLAEDYYPYCYNMPKQ